MRTSPLPKRLPRHAHQAKLRLSRPIRREGRGWREERTNHVRHTDCEGVLFLRAEGVAEREGGVFVVAV